MITRVSSVIRPKGSDLIFDHPYNADSVLEVCLSATPVRGVHIGDSGAKRLLARKGLTGLRLCVMERNSGPATSAICPRIPVFGAARCSDRTCTAADGRREERSQTGSLVARRSPRPGASRSSRSRPARLPGRPGADHQGEWRGGPAYPRQASWRPAARCSFAGPSATIGQVRIRWPAGCSGCCQRRGG